MRLGCGVSGSKSIKRHMFFKTINWKQLEKKTIEPPYLPIEGTTGGSNSSTSNNSTAGTNHAASGSHTCRLRQNERFVSDNHNTVRSKQSPSTGTSTISDPPGVQLQLPKSIYSRVWDTLYPYMHIQNYSTILPMTSSSSKSDRSILNNDLPFIERIKQLEKFEWLDSEASIQKSSQTIEDKVEGNKLREEKNSISGDSHGDAVNYFEYWNYTSPETIIEEYNMQMNA